MTSRSIAGSAGLGCLLYQLRCVFRFQIETYLKVKAPPNAKGALINFGTWQSAIYGFAMAFELKALRRKLFPNRLPPMKPRLSSRGLLHHSEVVGSYLSYTLIFWLEVLMC